MKRLFLGLFLITLVFGLLFTFTGCGPDDAAPAPDPDPDDPAPPADDEVFEWRWQCAYPEADLEYVALQTLFDEVYDRTDGRLKITAYAEGQIVADPADQLEAASTGVVDVSHSSGMYVTGQVPVADFEAGLPGQYPGFGYIDDYINMLYEFEDGALYNLVQEAYMEQADVYYLGSHSFHGYPVIYAKEPLLSPEDYQGKVIRAAGALQDMFNAFGASATFVAGGEIYTGLQLGTLDAAVWSIEGFLEHSLYEVAPYVHIPTISGHTCSHVTISPDSWNALPADIQEILFDSYKNTYIPYLFSLYDAEWQRVLGSEEEFGYTVVEVPDETMQAIIAVARDEIWADIADTDDYTREAMQIVDRWYEQNQ